MVYVGTIFNMYVYETCKKKEWILQIRKVDGSTYSKVVSRATYIKKKIGDPFKYFGQ